MRGRIGELLLCLFAGAGNTAGADFAAILGGSGQDYASAVTSDAQGNTYVVGLTYSPDFPVTAGVVQTKFGGACDAFIAKLGPDGKKIWSTYLGGILDDFATGVALDGAGNVLVTGWTRSGNFPLLNPVKSTLNGINADDYDAFVAKLDPNGTRLAYSTFLGGTGDDGAAGIAVDAAGDAFVAVTVQSAIGYPGLSGISNAPNQFGVVVSKLDPQGALVYSFFHRSGVAGSITLDAAGSAYVAGTAFPAVSGSPTYAFGATGTGQAMAFKLTPDGTQKVFETWLGGSVRADGTAIALNSAGEIYVAGTTSSVDFPLVNPLQSSPGARPLWKSTDGGTTWTPLDDLPFALPQMLLADPGTPTTIYAATRDLGVFKSVDGGATSTSANSGIAGVYVQAIAIDPVHPQTLYAAAEAGVWPAFAVYKSVDGAGTWTLIDSVPQAINQIAVDAQNPDIVWEIGTSLRKSMDAGATWNPVGFPLGVQSMVLDPGASGHLFAISQMVFCGLFCGSSNQPPHLYRSVDGGANWIEQASLPTGVLAVDPSTSPSTVYDGLGLRSVDGGVTFSPITPPPGAYSFSNLITVDPAGTVYSTNGRDVFVSHDHAQTWTAAGSFIPPPAFEAGGPTIISLVPAGSAGTLYATIYQTATSGFVTRLSADGSSIVYSTYLRGHASMDAFLSFVAEPNVFMTQTWISAMALDAAGNVTVAGGTRAVDLPVVGPAQAANAGLSDAFAATISADGSALTYATYFGGSQDDGALAVTLDAQGSVVMVGQTWSGDFPIPGGVQPPTGFGEAFVVKLSPPAPPVSGESGRRPGRQILRQMPQLTIK